MKILRPWLIPLLAAIFLMIASIVTISPTGDYGRRWQPTTYNYSLYGWRAAADYLEAIGAEPKRWRLPLHELSMESGRVLFLTRGIHPLREPLTPDEIEAVLTWTRAGNRLVLAGPWHEEIAGSLLLQRAGVELDLSRSRSQPFQFSADNAYGLLRARLLAQPEESTRLNQDLRQLTLPETAPLPITLNRLIRVLWKSAEGPIVVSFDVGQGEIIWTATAGIFDNQHLQRSDNLEFFLRLSSGADGTPRVTFDEFHHGFQDHFNLGKIITLGSVPVVVAMTLLILVIYLVSTLPRISRIYPAAASHPGATREHIQAAGRLYWRGGHLVSCLRLLHHHVRHRLSQRALGAPESHWNQIFHAPKHHLPSWQTLSAEINQANLSPERAVRCAQRLHQWKEIAS